jgi:hypothetical protein
MILQVFGSKKGIVSSALLVPKFTYSRRIKMARIIGFVILIVFFVLVVGAVISKVVTPPKLVGEFVNTEDGLVVVNWEKKSKTLIPTPPNHNARASWGDSISPDGQMAVSVITDDHDEAWIQINDLTGKHVILDRGEHPIWSPDGQWIMYAFPTAPNDGYMKIKMSTPYGDAKILINTSNLYDCSPAGWSEDSEWITFGCWGGTRTLHVYKMQRAGSELSQIWEGQPNEHSFVSARNGRIAYIHMEQDGTSFANVIEPGSKEPYRLDYSKNWQASPIWSPDGQRLLIHDVIYWDNVSGRVKYGLFLVEWGDNRTMRAFGEVNFSRWRTNEQIVYSIGNQICLLNVKEAKPTCF